MDKEYFPVKAGHGHSIHAGVVTSESTVIIAGKPTLRRKYSHICGTGNSTYFHSHHVAHAQLVPNATLADVNCKSCLRLLERRHASSVQTTD